MIFMFWMRGEMRTSKLIENKPLDTPEERVDGRVGQLDISVIQ